jgi:hypothetical protein
MPSTTKAEAVIPSSDLRTVGTVDGMTQVQNTFFEAHGSVAGLTKANDLLYDAFKDLTDEHLEQYDATLFGCDASRAAEITFQAQKAKVEGHSGGYGEFPDTVQPASR